MDLSFSSTSPLAAVRFLCPPGTWCSSASQRNPALFYLFFWKYSPQVCYWNTQHLPEKATWIHWIWSAFFPTLCWFYMKMSWLKNSILKLTVTKIRNIITLYFPGKELLSQTIHFIARIILFFCLLRFPKESNSCRAGRFYDHQYFNSHFTTRLEKRSAEIPTTSCVTSPITLGGPADNAADNCS